MPLILPRRLLLVFSLSLGLAGLAETTIVRAAESTASNDKNWKEADRILARIKEPSFPKRDFPVTDSGAVGDGKSDCTDALKKAIAACHAAGGGRVVVPAGTFLTGPIHLLSNVNLHLEKGATLQFKTDPKAYLPVVYCRWEGIECMNYSPFIYAFEQENIAVTGQGTLDGAASAENWWAWARKHEDRTSDATPAVKKMLEMGDKKVPVAQRVFGEGSFLRPNFFEPYRCRNVMIEGVTINRSPMWEINPVLCTNVIVRGVTIESYGPNNDGCDPEACRDVLIENCSFTTGDDCIAIKSGRNDDGRRVGVASENLVIRHCRMQDGHAGVAIGSEISGGCRNVFIEDCTMDSPHLERALRLKSNARRGGVIENIYMRNVQIGSVAEALLTVDLLYEEGAKGDFPPIVRNVYIDHVTSKSSPRLFYMVGFKAATIDNINVSHSTFEGVEATELMNNVGKVTLDDVTIVPLKKTRSLSSREGPP